jgi:hypothetical protein
MLMSDGNDLNAIGDLPVDDQIGKSGHECSPQILRVGAANLDVRLDQ